ncbi:MAG TPA: ribonuclease E/G, partial [Verrucomicrobiae bacterium]|nr:ribonuclease E/G [Verrucomicrobiae bacterium]
MSNNKFSRRQRGMRFRPRGGLGHGQQQKPDREATQARADVVSEQGGSERVFEKRHATEIERAENLAAGLPPDGVAVAETNTVVERKEFREPHTEIPAQVQESRGFRPVEIKEPSKGILDSIKTAATTLVKKVQRLIRPEKKIHKEVVINAETLETRVAVLEDGKLEEFNIERTTEERLVGSIFKGKVRNLEDGLKAAFVDIGFEKNAFLHYWDIVPNQFDSGVEIVERPAGRRPQKPKITQKDIPRLYP